MMSEFQGPSEFYEQNKNIYLCSESNLSSSVVQSAVSSLYDWAAC